MPSMLGMTTDPSPHGLGSREPFMGKMGSQLDNDNANGNMQLAKRADASITPNLDADFFSANKRQTNGKDDDSDSEDEKLNTIKGRNRAAAKEMETLLWRALCDKPKSAIKYIAKDAIMSNRFLFGDAEIRSKESDPPLEEELKNAEEYMAYKMHDPQVVEIDLMAVAISYRVTLFKQVESKGKNTFETIEATCSSSWRQVASGDWVLCSMLAS